MRMLTVSIVIGPLVLIGTLPTAGQSTLALGSGAGALGYLSGPRSKRSGQTRPASAISPVPGSADAFDAVAPP
jgi:hypothetical protein